MPAQLPGEPVIELPVLPPLEDRLRFPTDQRFVMECWRRSEAALKFHDSHRPVFPDASALRGAWEVERQRLSWARRAWYQLDDVVTNEGNGRRCALRNLREVLGPDLYYQGWMPPPWGETGPLKARKEW